MRSWKILAIALAGLLAATGTVTGALPAAQAAANDPFNPKVVFNRSTDAARRDTRFYLRVDQADGEQQIGSIKLSLPGGATDFLLDTDIPGANYSDVSGANNTPAQLGVFHIEAYYSPNGNPARQTIALDGQVYDDNDAAGCLIDECIRVIATVPIVNVQLNATIKIPHPGDYEVIADISGVWNDSTIRSLDIRLKQLIIDLPAKKGTHTVFRNPTVQGTGYSFDYELKSAKIDSLQHAGGASPNCGVVCSIPLPTLDYAPTAPTAKSPFNGSLLTANTAVTLSWQPSTDENLDDPMGYVVDVDGVPSASQSATTLALGSLAPGVHTWSVTATDSHGESTTAGPYTFELRSTAGALVFTSVAVNTDKLWVFPGVGGGFIYSLNGSQAQNQQYGAKVGGLTDSSLINYSGRFTLIALYNATLKSAAGLFEPASLRLLSGAGTGTTGA